MPQNRASQQSLFRNTISTIGLVIAVGGFFSFFLLMVLDLMATHSNPYVGILTWMVAPAFIFLGPVPLGAGAWLARRKMQRETG